jgi:hypothetical protein
MLYTMEHGRRVIRPREGEAWVEDRKASPSYVAISPDVIRDKLDAAGYHVEMSFPRFHNKPMRRTVMTVHEPRAMDDDEYDRLASLCFDHQGRMTLRGQPGALRLGCDNEFYAAPMRIHHCSEAARDFLTNPVPYVEKLMDLGTWLPRRIESLRSVYNGKASVRYARWLNEKRPRLGRRVTRCLPEFYGQDGASPWSFIQAVTRAQQIGRRSPQLEDLATNLLTVGYDALYHGRDPVGDALLTVKPELFELNLN